MNPLIREAAGAVQGGWILGVMTAVFLATFLFWLWYAYAPAHRARFEEAGRMPLDDEPLPPSEEVSVE